MSRRLIFKRLLLFLTATLLLLIICFFDLINYGLAQFRGQAKIIINARPIEEVLADPAFPDSLKQKLGLIQEIKAFAVDSLGLKGSDNYTTVYDQKGKPVLSVLTACAPFEFRNYTWWFPVLGNVSYKGFFDFKKGKKERDELRKQKYDVSLGYTSAWSTLGWFRDPILSGMLKRQEGDLANLIIHELTHTTLYVKGDVDYNENLANFIGDIGARKFLSYRYDDASDEMKEYLGDIQDDSIFNSYVLKHKSILDAYYRTSRSKSDTERHREKKARIQAFLKGIDSLPLNGKQQIINYAEDVLKTGNAFFMSFERYNAERQLFEQEFFPFHGDVRRYIDSLEALHGKK